MLPGSSSPRRRSSQAEEELEHDLFVGQEVECRPGENDAWARGTVVQRYPLIIQHEGGQCSPPTWNDLRKDTQEQALRTHAQALERRLCGLPISPRAGKTFSNARGLCSELMNAFVTASKHKRHRAAVVEHGKERAASAQIACHGTSDMCCVADVHDISQLS